MHDLDTIAISEEGHAVLPSGWLRKAGLLKGGLCDVRILDDGRPSLLITPCKQKRRGAAGLLAHLRKQTGAFPIVERN